MSVGRGNRKSKKIHAKSIDTAGRRLTACNLPQARRYVRNGNESAEWFVNCPRCLKALVASSTFEEFLMRTGIAETGQLRERYRIVYSELLLGLGRRIEG